MAADFEVFLKVTLVILLPPKQYRYLKTKIKIMMSNMSQKRELVNARNNQISIIQYE